MGIGKARLCYLHLLTRGQSWGLPGERVGGTQLFLHKPQAAPVSMLEPRIGAASHKQCLMLVLVSSKGGRNKSAVLKANTDLVGSSKRAD